MPLTCYQYSYSQYHTFVSHFGSTLNRQHVVGIDEYEYNSATGLVAYCCSSTGTRTVGRKIFSSYYQLLAEICPHSPKYPKYRYLILVQYEYEYYYTIRTSYELQYWLLVTGYTTTTNKQIHVDQYPLFGTEFLSKSVGEHKSNLVTFSLQLYLVITRLF